MESVVKNQPRKCLCQSQTFYRQVLPNSQGTHNSNFIHTVPENGKRKNIYQFILWGQYNQTKEIQEGKITANLTHDMDKKKKSYNEIRCWHSFIHSFILSVIQQIFIECPPCTSRHCANKQRAWGLREEMSNKANDHTQ